MTDQIKCNRCGVTQDSARFPAPWSRTTGPVCALCTGVGLNYPAAHSPAALAPDSRWEWYVETKSIKSANRTITTYEKRDGQQHRAMEYAVEAAATWWHDHCEEQGLEFGDTVIIRIRLVSCVQPGAFQKFMVRREMVPEFRVDRAGEDA